MRPAVKVSLVCQGVSGDGDLAYARDTWVDGRYVGEWRCHVPGETFADHPTSSIILRNVIVPQITYDSDYRYNSTTSQYEPTYSDIKVVEVEKAARFNYEDGEWRASYNAFDEGCASYDTIANLVKMGLIDQKYLDMVTITQDEVEGFDIDANTNDEPDKGFIFDGTVQPGREFDHHGKGHTWDQGKRTVEPACTEAGEIRYTCTVCGKVRTEELPALGYHQYGDWTVTWEPTADSDGERERTCTVCGQVEYEAIPATGASDSDWGWSFWGDVDDKVWKKVANPMKIQVKAKTVKYKKVKKKKQVAKGAKKNTYKIRVKVKAAGNRWYKAKTKTVTVKIKVK